MPLSQLVEDPGDDGWQMGVHNQVLWNPHGAVLVDLQFSAAQFHQPPGEALHVSTTLAGCPACPHVLLELVGDEITPRGRPPDARIHDLGSCAMSETNTKWVY